MVHTDIDFMYYQPMDDIFDAMLLPHDSEEGKIARKKIEMEYPEKVIPDNIQAYLTRDYHQVIPGRKAGENEANSGFYSHGMLLLLLFALNSTLTSIITFQQLSKLAL